jgi:hypothetical protein
MEVHPQNKLLQGGGDCTVSTTRGCLPFSGRVPAAMAEFPSKSFITPAEYLFLLQIEHPF